MLKYTMTDGHAKQICEIFGKNYEEMDEYEICEMFDILIDKVSAEIEENEELKSIFNYE